SSQASCADGATPYNVTLGYPGMSGGSAYSGIVPLYGTTTLGGAANLGVVFALTPGGGSWTETVIHDFCQDASCSDGKSPAYGVVVDGAGNIFGQTGQGGKHSSGVLFEMVETGGNWTYGVVHNFCAETSCADGNNPVGPLLTDIDLNVYGTTDGGGSQGFGVAFKLVPNGAKSKLFVLHNFCEDGGNCVDGAHPRGGLVQDSIGLIYGVAGFGGDLNVGTVWRLSGAKHTVFTRLVSFGDASTPGGSPLGGLFIVNPNGPFYGTASFGGANNNGVLFKLKK
ncbi:MAG TPA: choice-of-anchor tandem repeat GloVer-containing protein, partial [Rhizomicrobium sp.]|nr:choice-of-anchor tandem repeat GloVer-containing protein [Rhizomicrobium sp.]